MERQVLDLLRFGEENVAVCHLVFGLLDGLGIGGESLGETEENFLLNGLLGIEERCQP